MAMQDKQNGLSRLEKQLSFGGTGSEPANGEAMANNGELMVAIMGAIAAYIQMEQQTPSNDDIRG